MLRVLADNRKGTEKSKTERIRRNFFNWGRGDRAILWACCRHCGTQKRYDGYFADRSVEPIIEMDAAARVRSKRVSLPLE